MWCKSVSLGFFIFFLSRAGVFAQPGTFAPKIDYGTGVGPVSLFAADLDGDYDLAVANFGVVFEPASTVSVLKNNGDGTFAPQNRLFNGNQSRLGFCRGPGR